MNEYDKILRQILTHLKETPYEDRTAVIAAVYDPPDKLCIALSSKFPDGRWNHAERNATLAYIGEYGPPSKDAVLITSLSPCYLDNPHRNGVSCTHLALGKDTKLQVIYKKIHVGHIDPLQGLTIDDYAKMNVDVTLTSDPVLADVCHDLFRFFELDVDKQTYIDDVLKKL